MVRSVACAVVFIIGCAAAAGAQDLKAKGQQVFADQKCAFCHAIAGKGNAKGPLDAVGSKLSADEIRGATAVLRKLDRNGDGTLTMDEIFPAMPGRGRG